MKLINLTAALFLVSQANASIMHPETYERIKPQTTEQTRGINITDGFGNNLMMTDSDEVAASIVPVNNSARMENAPMETAKIMVPELTPVTPVTKKVTFKTLDVPFDTNSTQVNGSWLARITAFVKSLSGQKYSKIELTGFSDPRGNLEYNAALSKKRALAVQKVLKENGMSATRIEVIGAGIRESTTMSEARVVEMRVLR